MEDGQIYTSRVEPQLDVKSKSARAKIAKDGPRVTGMLEEEVDFKGKSTMTRNAKDGPRVYKSMDNAVERRKFGVRNEDGVVRNHINAKKAIERRDFPNRFNDNSLEVERAAFQSFDEFGDIMDRPRVSQMEMEQRIQKLANWLNGADVGMPEWMFSKMMRSAQTIFTDHSTLRVIQVLGKLGNWRRVSQVIEWLQMRERFKSHKLRYFP